MKIKEALIKRKSTRAFLKKDVPLQIIQQIITQAGNAPSGVNTQPWEVAVITGKTKNSICKKMENAFRAGVKGKMEYQYYPIDWQDKYKQRRKECGLLMYGALEIKRADKQKQLDQWAANYRGFDAPVILLFFMNDSMQTGSYLDYGMFLQSIMLSAVALGLATCPQASLAEYPEIVRKELNYSADKKLLCGISLGYEDTTKPVNNYRTSRENLDSFVQYFD